MEMLVASAVGALLVGGMASSIHIASRGLDIADGSSGGKTRTARVLDQIVRDLRHAQRFSEQTSTAVTFTVPDRNGDGMVETIRYAWNGVPGDPLTYEFNGMGSVHLAQNVDRVDFSYTTRKVLAPYIRTSQPTVVFEGFSEERQSSPATSITVGTPADTRNGDLLIAAVVYDGEKGFHDPAEWSSLVEAESDNKRVSLAVWWRIAGTTEPVSHTFSWDPSEQAYGWIMRFRGHDLSSPIDATLVDFGIESSPTAPDAATSLDNCLVLRIGGFDRHDIYTDDAGMTSHTTITMDQSSTLAAAVSGGAAYSLQPTSGNTGTAQFALSAAQEFVVATIAIAPEQLP